MSEVAYGKRDYFKIWYKSIIGLLLIILKKHGRRLLYPNHVSKNIAVLPGIKNKETLGDIANRIAWGYPNKENLTIYILVSRGLLATDLKSINVPDSQFNYLQKNDISHIQLVDKLPKTKDTFLIWKAGKLWNPFNFWRIPRSFIIDKNFFSYTESRTWRDSYWDTLEEGQMQEIIDLSRQNFQKLSEETSSYTKSYCFVTGPSFDNYKSINYEPDSIKVICNSVVKNHEFLEHIKQPHVLTFADPVFHFSPNNYSTQFRKQAIECFNNYNCYIVIPLKTVPLMLSYFPEIRNKVIGVDWGWNLKFPTKDDLEVKHSGNILTYFMIPFASTLADEINVIGADGRQPNENYFWKHSKTAQYDDLMNDVFDTHPSFFRDRDYKDYYEGHCENLEKMIQFGEQKGKKYFSLTKSYIPAFQKRFKQQ